MRDVTAALMGDPDPHRKPVPLPPEPLPAKKIWSRRRINKGWLRSLNDLEIGATVTGITHYAANAARNYARVNGFQIRAYRLGGNLYAIQRVF